MSAGSVVYRFWMLPGTTRHEILTSLIGPWTREDWLTPEAERYTRMFKRLREEGLVDRFVEAVSAASGSGGGT